MYWTVIILWLLIGVAFFLISYGASECRTQEDIEADDRDQEEYINKWLEEKGKK